MGLDLSLNCHADTGNRHRGKEKWQFEYTVKVVPNLGAEKHGKCVGFLRLETNRTWLQLVRSCTFLLDPGVPIFRVSKCRNALGDPNARSVCQSVELHWVFQCEDDRD